MLEYKQIVIYIFIIGAAQGILLSIFLFNKKENKTANLLLSLTMLIFAFDLLAGVTFLTGYIKNVPFLLGLNNSLPYLYGPAIFLYTVILGRKQEGFKKSYWFHAIPFLLVQVYGIFFFYFEDFSYQLSLLDFSTPRPWHINLIGNLIPIHGSIYIVLTIIQVFKFNRSLKNSYSNIEKLNLNWLNYLVSGSAIIWLVVLFTFLLNFIFGESLEYNLLIYITISFVLYGLGIKSLRQPEVILFENQHKTIYDDSIKKSSYEKSGLADNTAEQYLQDLLVLMNEQKPYLNEKLNLSDLSQMLNISTHNLSEVINKKLNQNFYDFINKYRVEEVKKLIADDKDSLYSILALGLEGGFSSKSAFYSAFKKVSGITPAQYRSTLNI